MLVVVLAAAAVAVVHSGRVLFFPGEPRQRRMFLLCCLLGDVDFPGTPRNIGPPPGGIKLYPLQLQYNNAYFPGLFEALKCVLCCAFGTPRCTIAGDSICAQPHLCSVFSSRSKSTLVLLLSRRTAASLFLFLLSSGSLGSSLFFCKGKRSENNSQPCTMTTALETCPSSASFFGYMGVASAMVFGSEYTFSHVKA